MGRAWAEERRGRVLARQRLFLVSRSRTVRRCLVVGESPAEAGWLRGGGACVAMRRQPRPGLGAPLRNALPFTAEFLPHGESS